MRAILCTRPYHHPMLGFRLNYNVLQLSQYGFRISPFSFCLDHCSNLGITMPPDRLNPLIMGELVWQVPCSREKVNCLDGFSRVFIGEDSECKLADDLGVGAILCQGFQGMQVGSLIEICCLLNVEARLQVGRGKLSIRSIVHFNIN